MSRKRFARTATGVPALAALALAVAACSPQHPGAAATVGNTRVSVTALNTAVAVAVQTPDATTGQLPNRTTAVQSSLTQIIRDDLIADAARAKGVTVTEAEIQSLLQQERQTNGSDEATAKANGIPFAGLHAAVYQALLLNKLITALAPGQTDQTAQSAALTTYLGKIATQEGVSVNPRYGAWQAQQFAVVASDAFSSSVPTAPATG
ncbi:MAG TPA: SurA N-terminal domain-containing protein [Acidothermaceae bacterium]|nr:SurA N-terminal domain-containing protein [Acidothermaceae bacterium]